MQPKDPPPVAVDPNLAAEQARAKETLISSLQTQAMGDTANLMARFGTRMALAGGMTAPMAAPAPVPAKAPFGGGYA